MSILHARAHIFGILSLLFLAAAPLAHAQVSAGSLLQENQQLAPPTVALPDALPKEEPKAFEPLTPKPGQVSFTVKQFVFTGNAHISNDDLQKLVAGFLNRPITFDDLKRITESIDAYYLSQGWLVRALLPQQDITEGTVTIRIIEAKLGGVKINNQSKRVSDSRIEDWIYSNIPQAGELSLEELDRTILTLNDLPDVTVTSSLQEGGKPGETILLLTVEDKPLINGQLAVDNFGDSNSGKVRGTALVNVNGPLGFGDQLSAYAMYSLGNTYGRLSYTLPVGTDGLRVGINGSAMEYRVLNQSFSSLWANGNSTTGGVEATYPLIRSRPANLIGVVNWNYNQFSNWTIQGLNIDQTYNTSVAQFGFNGNLIDDLLGGGLNVGSLMGSAGNVDRNASGTYNSYYGVAGNFLKMRYGYNRTQAITDSLSAYVSVSGQLASKNMDSSEQLYLGGPTNVRAYGSGQGPASQGNLSTVELRQNLPYQTQLAAFYDLGNVQTWKYNNPTVNGVNNTYNLQGLGAYFSWYGPYGFNLKATWAMRTGSLPDSVVAYLNQNGGTSNNRVWLNASIPF